MWLAQFPLLELSVSPPVCLSRLALCWSLGHLTEQASNMRVLSSPCPAPSSHSQHHLTFMSAHETVIGNTPSDEWKKEVQRYGTSFSP